MANITTRLLKTRAKIHIIKSSPFVSMLQIFFLHISREWDAPSCGRKRGGSCSSSCPTTNARLTNGEKKKGGGAPLIKV